MCEWRQLPVANVQMRTGNWNWILATLATFLPLVASFASGINPVQNNSAWNLPPGAHVEGDTLVVEIAPEATGRRDVRAAAEIDVSDAFAAMQCVAATVAVRGVGVSEPPHAWQGVKVQLSYTDFFGDRVYRDATLPRGTFDRTNVTVRVSPLLAPLGIPGGRVSLLLGLEGCTGRAEFDLASLRIATEDVGIPRANEDGIVRNLDEDLQPQSGDLQARSADLAPEGRLHAAHRRPPLRGCMLPQRGCRSAPPPRTTSRRCTGGARRSRASRSPVTSARWTPTPTSPNTPPGSIRASTTSRASSAGPTHAA